MSTKLFNSSMVISFLILMPPSKYCIFKWESQYPILHTIPVQGAILSGKILSFIIALIKVVFPELKGPINVTIKGFVKLIYTSDMDTTSLCAKQSSIIPLCLMSSNKPFSWFTFSNMVCLCLFKVSIFYIVEYLTYFTELINPNNSKAKAFSIHLF